MNCEHEVEFAQHLAEVDARSKSNTRRLDRLEKLTEVVSELATSMKLMADEQKRTTDKVSSMDGKLTALEQAPAKRWKFVIEKIAIYVIATVVGFCLAKLGVVV